MRIALLAGVIALTFGLAFYRASEPSPAVSRSMEAQSMQEMYHNGYRARYVHVIQPR